VIWRIVFEADTQEIAQGQRILGAPRDAAL